MTKLPSVSYVRECRTVIQILNDLLGDYKLGMNATWKQLCTDGTTQRQIGFQSLVIGLLTEKDFELVIASSCIFMDDKTLEMQLKVIEDKVHADTGIWWCVNADVGIWWCVLLGCGFR